MKLARFKGDEHWMNFEGATYKSAAIALVEMRYEQYELSFGVGIHVQVKDPDVGVIMDFTVTPHVEYSVGGLRGGDN